VINKSTPNQLLNSLIVDFTEHPVRFAIFPTFCYVLPMSYLYSEDPRDYLKFEMEMRQQRRPAYSLRAFARDLEIAPSTLVDFLKGRIGFSKERIFQISRKIKLTPDQMAHWEDLMISKYSKDLALKNQAEIKVKYRISSEKNSINLDQFKIVSEWFHLAFLELIEMDSSKYSDLTVAAKALGVPIKTMRIVVKRLIKCKLLNQYESGRYKATQNTFVGDTLPSQAIRSYHFGVLSKAQKALENQDMNERYSSSTIMSVSEEDLKYFFEQLKKAPIKLFEKRPENNSPRNKLYALSLQFFSLLNDEKESHRNKEKKV
jgi:uncharacterized protein (TIGR02147 family)